MQKNNFMYEGADRLTGNTHIVQRRPGKSISSLINPCLVMKQQLKEHQNTQFIDFYV